jgi:hypothetical protein
MDKYQDVRSIPLRSVLAQLGFTGFKKRPAKKECYGNARSINPRKTTRLSRSRMKKFKLLLLRGA